MVSKKLSEKKIREDLEYVNKTFHTNYQLNETILFQGFRGKILSATNAFLQLQLEQNDLIIEIHPTWQVQVLTQS